MVYNPKTLCGQFSIFVRMHDGMMCHWVPGGNFAPLYVTGFRKEIIKHLQPHLINTVIIQETTMVRSNL